MDLISTKIEKKNIYIIELNNPKKRNPLSMEIIADPEVQKFNAESFDF